MDFKITKVTKPFRIKGGNRQVVNVCNGEVVATITTRYEAISFSNIISLAHYPMSVVLTEYD